MKYCLLPLMLIMVYLSTAQSISSSVIALAGGFEKTPGGMTLSWTVGEPIVDPIRSDNILLTQGFQQPGLRISTGYEDLSFQYDLRVYPNPTSHVLQMQSDFPETITFQLVDINGKLIRKDSWMRTYQLDVSGLSSGVYAIYYIAKGSIVKSELISKH